jgi:hypothetical protein
MKKTTIYKVTGFRHGFKFCRYFANEKEALLCADTVSLGKVCPVTVTTLSPHFLRAVAGFPCAQ